MKGEFKEIGHSGNKITFEILTNAEGHRGYQTRITDSSQAPIVMTEAYAFPGGRRQS